MAQASATVTTLLVQVAELRRAQDDLRDLLKDTLRTVLEVTQAQSEANLRFIRLVEMQTAVMQTTLAVSGPGRTREYSEEQEAADYRRSVDRTADL